MDYYYLSLSVIAAATLCGWAIGYFFTRQAVWTEMAESAERSATPAEQLPNGTDEPVDAIDLEARPRWVAPLGAAGLLTVLVLILMRLSEGLIGA